MISQRLVAGANRQRVYIIVVCLDQMGGDDHRECRNSEASDEDIGYASPDLVQRLLSASQ